MLLNKKMGQCLKRKSVDFWLSSHKEKDSPWRLPTFHQRMKVNMQKTIWVMAVFSPNAETSFEVYSEFLRAAK